MAASNLNLGKASGGVLNVQPADGTTTTSLVLPAINGTVVAADSNGNVGIGVIPSAWHTSAKAIDFGGKSAFGFLSSSTDYTLIYHNSYVNQSGFDIYKQNGYASSLIQNDGKFTWRTAPNGTAGNTITWNTAMTLDSNGNVGIGVTPIAWNAYKGIQIGSYADSILGFQAGGGNINIIHNATSTDNDATWQRATANACTRYKGDGLGNHTWSTAPSGTAGGTITWTNTMTLDSSGNLGLGVIPSVSTLPTIQSQFNILAGQEESNLNTNAYYSGGVFKYIANGYATSYIQQKSGGNHTWRVSPYGTAGNTITWTNAMTLDGNGNLGIGVTPSAWYGAIKGIDIGDSSAFYGYTGSSAKGYGLISNAYRNSSGNYIYKSTEKIAIMESYNGSTYWFTAPSGTAGTIATLTTAMILDNNGNLGIGMAPASTYRLNVVAPNTAEGTGCVMFQNNAGTSGVYIYSVNATGYSGTGSAIYLGKNSVTSRSINAGGTINASGADYAEYEYSNDITLVKGQIVGFKEDGTLTDKYSESIRFAIKSTNPSIVGGDVWGCEEIVGKKPEQPVKSEEMTDEEFAKLEEQYEKDLEDFEARLEVERQKVDRIAYAGKVPVNVYGAVAGQYVVAIEKEDGTIDGKLVNKVDMTFSKYQDAVGRVNKILDDGRAEVAVIIH